MRESAVHEEAIDQRAGCNDVIRSLLTFPRPLVKLTVTTKSFSDNTVINKGR